MVHQVTLRQAFNSDNDLVRFFIQYSDILHDMKKSVTLNDPDTLKKLLHRWKNVLYTKEDVERIYLTRWKDESALKTKRSLLSFIEEDHLSEIVKASLDLERSRCTDILMQSLSSRELESLFSENLSFNHKVQILTYIISKGSVCKSELDSIDIDLNISSVQLAKKLPLISGEKRVKILALMISLDKHIPLVIAWLESPLVWRDIKKLPQHVFEDLINYLIERYEESKTLRILSRIKEVAVPTTENFMCMLKNRKQLLVERYLLDFLDNEILPQILESVIINEKILTYIARLDLTDSNAELLINHFRQDEMEVFLFKYSNPKQLIKKLLELDKFRSLDLTPFLKLLTVEEVQRVLLDSETTFSRVCEIFKQDIIISLSEVLCKSETKIKRRCL